MKNQASKNDENFNTKAKILDIAIELFAEKSYHQVTVRDIKNQVGISTGGLFYYFDSKLEIAKESLFQWMKNAYNPLYRSIDENSNPKKNLEELINFSIDLFMKRPKIMRFFLELYEVEVQNKNKSPKMLQIFNEFIAFIKNLMESYKIPNPKYKAHLLVACLDGLMFQYIFSKYTKVWLEKDILKQEMFELFIKNLKTK
ncbi:MAG: hypothetical protein BAJALOKI2v1_50055 [Promethearchaeota archaeon]|nr:MAG: hypothetical protein BAJALOKI2v1_50055 [Candidatus Lokiarchaeota archaeon]